MNSELNKRDLTLDELVYLESEMINRRKSKDAAWGLWAGLSFFGAHRFFTEDYRYASAMFLTTFIPLLIVVASLFNETYNFIFNFSLFLLFSSVIWSWIDAFFLNARITNYNEKAERAVLQSILNNRRL
ncbi:TM2 domain-containing protein [Rossellomorea aquimaris]|uniref:TM2 domain-containing protein n=1 Tax=Rossellomorea aquimaris TaxID=189382 RepID=UPI0007D0930D|nr:TM2 domain-containing protein [Rossellomorea aquimaris]